MQFFNEREEAIEISKNLYWVGDVIPEDQFQCHVYLIDNGKESILIDPGSKITWARTREKILKIMPLENIKYFICQHQDPDITAALNDIFNEIGTKDRYLVTHWRTSALLKHYDLGVEFYEIEDEEWKLELKDFTLEFIFTPYMHFAGAFCTYFKEKKILFSSDIFGAFTPEFKLFVENKEEYFEQMKPFHTHYMPSSAIIKNGLDKILMYEIDLIAPQHGSIIKKEFIPYIISNLRSLDVGLFLQFNGDSNVKFLTKANEMISKIYYSVAFSINWRDVIDKVLQEFRTLFKVKRIESVAFLEDETIHFNSNSSTSKKIDFNPNHLGDCILKEHRFSVEYSDSLYGQKLDEKHLIYKFISFNEEDKMVGIIAFIFDINESLEDYKLSCLKNLEMPFNILLTKSISLYNQNKEQNKLIEKSITDPLTGIYNRRYLEENGKLEFEKARLNNKPFSVIILDLDKFKVINDTYGHNVGDLILKDFASRILKTVRSSDSVYRFGGDEFIIIMPQTTAKDAFSSLGRMRKKIIKSKGLSVENNFVEYSFSAGIKELSNEYKDLNELIKGADKNLYEAKEDGRNIIKY